MNKILSAEKIYNMSCKLDKLKCDFKDLLARFESFIFQYPQDLALKADLVSGKVPASQLPSYVDDVITGTKVGNTSFIDEITGTSVTLEKGKIYVDVSTGLAYRWAGSILVEISTSELPQVVYNIPTIYGSNVTAKIVKTGKQVTFNFNQYINPSQFATSGNGSPFSLCTLPPELIHNMVSDEIRTTFLSYSGLHLVRFFKSSGQVWFYPRFNVAGINATADSQYNLNITYQVN